MDGVDRLKHSEKMILVPAERWNQLLACEQKSVSDCGHTGQSHEVEEKLKSKDVNTNGDLMNHTVAETVLEDINESQLVPPGVPEKHIREDADNIEEAATSPLKSAQPDFKTVKYKKRSPVLKTSKKVKWLALPMKKKSQKN